MEAAATGLAPHARAFHGLDGMRDVTEFDIVRFAAEANRRNRKRETPFRIFALLLNRTLGEFIDQNVYAAHVKSLFDHAELICYYRDDRPFKQHVIDINPAIDHRIAMKEYASYPLDFFDWVGDRPVGHRDDRWYKLGMARPDLVLTPWMMDCSVFRRLRPTARLAIRPDRRDAFDAELQRRGLDPARWFCTLHYRESGYRYRPDRPARDHDPAVFEELAGRIIDELGGQVVRLGHPEMTRFADRPGYVDLSGVQDGFPLQAAAVARARFHLATPTGTTMLACALGTPHGHVCEVDGANAYFYGEHDYVLCSHLMTPDGRRVAPRSLFSTVFGTERWKETLIAEQGFRVIHNSVDEMIAMAKHMLVVTAGQTGWRTPAPPAAGRTPRPNAVRFPPELSDDFNQLVQFPELAPAAPVVELAEGSPALLPIDLVERRDLEWSGPDGR